MISDEQSHLNPSLTIRPGAADDLVSAHALFLDSVYDLAWRLGIQEGERTPTPEARAEDLQTLRPLLEHLTASADQYWIAERSGEVLGFSRSLLRDGVRELTEFFVSPRAQSSGVGRELLQRAMPSGAKRTYIIATPDLRAQALYHKLGLYQQCAIYTFYAKVSEVAPPSQPDSGDLAYIPITLAHISELAHIDQAIHGHRRDRDHEWFMTHRKGLLFHRAGQTVGYGYLGEPYNGPFALLEESDFPAALAHAEKMAIEQSFTNFAVDVPMSNRAAIAYLLARDYRMSPFFCFYMCDQKAEGVSNTIITAPMIMI